MSLRTLVCLAVAAALLLAVGGAGDAGAQTWSPKTKRERAPEDDKARKPRKKKRKPKPEKPPEPEKQPQPEPEPEPEPEPDIVEDDGAADTVEDEPEVEDGAAAGEDEDEEDEGFRIDDDMADVGADVEFSDSDLATDATGGEGKGVTRLETLAMAYARAGVDVVHDAVPPAVDGIEVVGEEVLTFRLHGRAEGTTRFGRRTKIKVAGRFNTDVALDANTNLAVQRYEAEVWDTYVDLYGSWIDFRFGNQIVSWGAADLLTPNDVVNPRDLRRGLLEVPDELRIPVLAASARVFDGPFALQVLWVPVAPTNRFELLDGDYALLGPNGATGIERKVGAIVQALASDPMIGPAISPIANIGAPPDNGIETGEVGASVSARFRRIDLFGYFFWGQDRTPRLLINDQLVNLFATTAPDDLSPELVAGTLQMLAQNGETALVIDYPRRTHFGAALATRVEPFGFKLDFGYTLGANTLVVPSAASGPLLAVPTSLDQSALTVSVDYDRGESFAVVVEGSYLQVVGVPLDRDVYQMDFDRLVLAAARLQWAPGNGPISVRLLGFVEVASQPSYALQPAVRLSGHDNLSLEVAATIYGGPDPSQRITFGNIADRNDQIVLTVQYGL